MKCLKNLGRYCHILMLPLLLVATGCGGLALRHAYKDYSEIYADSINRQLLLNLARLSHDEPPYFIQLGQINAQFTFNSSVSFSPSDVQMGPHVGGDKAKLSQENFTAGGSVGAGAIETPTFQFVPLNGDTFAQAIATPISEKVFLTFYAQGYPADELARVIVRSVEVEHMSGSPTDLYVNDPKDSSYADFLAFCHYLRMAQLQEMLIVDTIKPQEKVVFSDVKLSDALSAIASGHSVANSAADSKLYEVSPPGSIGLKRNLLDRRVKSASTFTVDTDIIVHTNVMAGSKYDEFLSYFEKKGSAVKFNTRTFVTALHSVAKEEGEFKQMTSQTNTVRKNPIKFGFVDGQVYGSFRLKRGALNEDGTTNDVLPVISLHNLRKNEMSKLVELTYHSSNYIVGDVEKDGVPIDRLASLPNFSTTEVNHTQYSNRRVFTFLSYLFTQIAIDPKKLPVQQFIQVH
ncbi:MAG: uncharacterized protein JWM68_2290 [Verrucomicrobiales bacterium]|nr:uncharacterized protein [Verrucomicrobiales bacterium]